jgi:CheY-like chemotaxis protein
MLKWEASGLKYPEFWYTAHAVNAFVVLPTCFALEGKEGLALDGGSVQVKAMVESSKFDHAATQMTHFLVVEDEDAHARLVELAIKEHNPACRVERAPDGRSALASLRAPGAARPDVILLDLNLPGMNGHEVLAAIKGDESLRSIPVVILSMSDSEQDRTRAYAAHANSYLRKPTSYDEFVEMARSIDEYWSRWNRPARGD